MYFIFHKNRGRIKTSKGKTTSEHEKEDLMMKKLILTTTVDTSVSLFA